MGNDAAIFNIVADQLRKRGALVIVYSVEQMFRERNDANHKDISTIIGEKIKETISISKLCKKQIDKMAEVFKESSFKDASTGKLTGGSK